MRDLRNRPRGVQDAVAEQSVAVTSNGKPFALVINIDADQDLIGVESAVRSARTQPALSRIRRRAVCSGNDRLTRDEIDAEIGAARSSTARALNCSDS